MRCRSPNKPTQLRFPSTQPHTQWQVIELKASAAVDGDSELLALVGERHVAILSIPPPLPTPPAEPHQNVSSSDGSREVSAAACLTTLWPLAGV